MRVLSDRHSDVGMRAACEEQPARTRRDYRRAGSASLQVRRSRSDREGSTARVRRLRNQLVKQSQPPFFASAPLLSDRLSFDIAGQATVRTGKVEIGQGILTALGQIAADELGLEPDRIRLVSGRTHCAPDEGYTAGSLSVVTSGAAVRAACAYARYLLIARFAARFA